MNVRALAAEFLGTAALLLAVVGSGITTSTGGAAPTQLFQHAVAVGAALFVLILVFGQVSGAHFNPAVTLADVLLGGMGARTGVAYCLAQVAGAVAGTVGTNLLFGLPAVTIAATDRGGLSLAVSEVVATLGLLMVIFAIVRSGRVQVVPAAVGAWIAAAIFLTPSASFANPAVTVARSLTDTYTGIAPAHVPGFLAAQLVGTGLAVVLISWLFAPSPGQAADAVVPHPSDGAPDE